MTQYACLLVNLNLRGRYAPGATPTSPPVLPGRRLTRGSWALRVVMPVPRLSLRQLEIRGRQSIRDRLSQVVRQGCVSGERCVRDVGDEGAALHEDRIGEA